VRVLRPVRQGEVLRWSDVAIEETLTAYRARREMEHLFGRVTPRQRVA
jgi:predicted homoserine dehydrogenase-like protein